MKCRRLMLCACGIAAILAPYVADAHPPFKTELKTQYGFKSVSCYACHAKGKDANGKPLGKEVRNELGNALADLLKEANVTQRLKAAKKASQADKDSVKEAVTKDFRDALEKLKSMGAPDGSTWDAYIKALKIPGVK